jgi:ABC-type glycerol-3-phosphate transport system permease component
MWLTILLFNQAFSYFNMGYASSMAVALFAVVMGVSLIVFSWNNFLFSVILAGRETRTLPIAVFNMISYERSTGAPWPPRPLITLPVLLVARFAQRHMVTGLTFGAVKQ